MLFLKGHGVTPVVNGGVDEYPKGKAMSAAAACGFHPGEYYDVGAKLGVFSYFFPDAAGLTEKECQAKALDDLSTQMIDNQPPDEGNSSIPPVFTYMGQFIDHDVTANTDREAGLSVIDMETVTPVARKEVEAGLGNLRFASLNLDSVYGGAPLQGDFAKVMEASLRWPEDRAKLEVGVDLDTPFPAIPLPMDRGRDLFRLGWARKTGQITDAELKKVPEELRDAFFNQDGTPRQQRAIIGDLRNDENLAVAQFHLAMVRLHNKVVDAAPSTLPLHDRDAVHAWAKQATQWTYQWLVMNAYLPAICDPDTLEMVKDKGAPLYTRFFKKHPPNDPDTMPMPLEFSVAAFRFGHTMVRAEYDWSRNFGRGDGALADRATFRQLFQFTSAGMTELRLPEHWPIEQERFVHPPTADTPDRAARKIDTLLVPRLHSMDNEPEGTFGVMKNLAKRNMRRGYRLNIPTAQGCLKDLRDTHGIDLPRLSAAQIASGHTKETILGGGFEQETPLWFYVLKEAEVMGQGESLGPLGTFLVADTLVGLMRCHPQSYLNAAPGGKGWQPEHTAKPNGAKITDMPSMMKAAGLL